MHYKLREAEERRRVDRSNSQSVSGLETKRMNTRGTSQVLYPTMKSRLSTFLLKLVASSFSASTISTSTIPAGIITTILFLSRLVLFRPSA